MNLTGAAQHRLDVGRGLVGGDAAEGVAHDDALRERLVRGAGEDVGEHGLACEHEGEAVARVHVKWTVGANA